MSFLSAELTPLFRDQLEKCAVAEGESVLVFTDPLFPFPEYAPAAMAGARALGAEAFTVVASSNDSLTSKALIELWKSVDMVVGISSLPWIRSPINEEALLASTRTLLVAEPVASLRRMFPDDGVVSRTYAGAKRIAAAREFRFADDYGTDLTMSKGERRAHAQCGLSNRPGRWDHWPSGLVASVPIEDSANGKFVAMPGDVVFRRHITAPLTLTLHDGRITDIDGGFEAMLLRQYLESFGDPEAYRLSHVGWGTEHRADWNFLSPGRLPTAPCPDQEGKLGTVTLAIGHNASRTGDEFSGLDGEVRTGAHIDISTRRKSVWLDGEQIVDHEEIVAADAA
jgi:2,5-dihydroxypyridine 5,6-dioxygenase